MKYLLRNPRFTGTQKARVMNPYLICPLPITWYLYVQSVLPDPWGRVHEVYPC